MAKTHQLRRLERAVDLDVLRELPPEDVILWVASKLDIPPEMTITVDIRSGPRWEP